MNNWLYFFRNFRLPVCEALRLPFPSEVPCPGNTKAFKKNVKAFEVKREGVLVKIPRRFRKVCIRPHIPIFPQQDTISYRHKISNLTATRLVIFRRKLVALLHEGTSDGNGSISFSFPRSLKFLKM